jgi:hypothetical protein
MYTPSPVHSVPGIILIIQIIKGCGFWEGFFLLLACLIDVYLFATKLPDFLHEYFEDFLQHTQGFPFVESFPAY